MSALLATSVDQLLAVAFAGPRSPRSPEYRAGGRVVLELRIAGRPIHRPYAVGTAQDDASDPGQPEGLAIWRMAQADAATGRS